LRHNERDLEFVRTNAANNPKALIEGRIATLNCASQKIDISNEEH
jgi:hypothetical protein